MANCFFCQNVLDQEHQKFCNKNCKSLFWRKLSSLHKYNVPPETYQQVYDNQEGNCAICEVSGSISPLLMDYDYQNNSLRGFLCKTCMQLVQYVSVVDKPVSKIDEVRAYIIENT